MNNSKKIKIFILLLLIGGGFLFWYFKRPERINELVKSFNFNDYQSFYSLSKISSWEKEALPVLEPFLESESVSERWASVFALSEISKENETLKDVIIPVLRQLKQDKDDNIRMLVGATLISLGEKEGIPILISCLKSKEIVHFSESTELVKDGSRAYLIQHTDYDGINFDKWQSWWGNNQHLIFWDQPQKTFWLKNTNLYFQ